MYLLKIIIRGFSGFLSRVGLFGTASWEFLSRELNCISVLAQNYFFLRVGLFWSFYSSMRLSRIGYLLDEKVNDLFIYYFIEILYEKHYLLFLSTIGMILSVHGMELFEWLFHFFNSSYLPPEVSHQQYYHVESDIAVPERSEVSTTNSEEPKKNENLFLYGVFLIATVFVVLLKATK